MHYKEYILADGRACARTACIDPNFRDAEAHAVITVKDSSLPFAQQLETVQMACGQLIRELPAEFKPVLKRYFLSDAANQAHLVPLEADCCISVVEQAPCDGSKVAMWIYLMHNASVSRLTEKTIKATRGSHCHYYTANVAFSGLSPEDATEKAFLDYEDMLQGDGMSVFHNCVRTWLFVHNIDNYYSGVVEGRNKAFDKLGLTLSTHFIASTGIAGRSANPNVAVLIDSYAIGNLNPRQIKYLRAESHLNSPAEYGVAFERGTAVNYGDRTHAFISGTASIDNKGQVLHEGDVLRQAARMLDNIEVLLDDGECGWDDVAMAIIYLRDMADSIVVSKYMQYRLPNVPYVMVHAPVCRPTWLIETECIAIRKNSHDGMPEF